MGGLLQGGGGSAILYRNKVNSQEAKLHHRKRLFPFTDASQGFIA